MKKLGGVCLTEIPIPKEIDCVAICSRFFSTFPLVVTSRQTDVPFFEPDGDLFPIDQVMDIDVRLGLIYGYDRNYAFLGRLRRMVREYLDPKHPDFSVHIEDDSELLIMIEPPRNRSFEPLDPYLGNVYGFTRRPPIFGTVLNRLHQYYMQESKKSLPRREKKEEKEGREMLEKNQRF